MDIAESVNKIIFRIVGLRPDISESEVSLGSQLGLDSYQFIVLRERLEQHFDISIADDDLIDLETVGDVVQLVSKYQKYTGSNPGE